MHISEGVLSGPVLLGGAVLAAVGTAVGLRRMDYDRIMTVAMLSAVFFVASLIHIPVGPSSVHLLMGGLLGLLLDTACIPAILVALLLQAVLFQFGGVTVLGVNTVVMAFPAVIAARLTRPLLGRGPGVRAFGAFACGALAVLLSGLFMATALALVGEAFLKPAGAVLLYHIPIMLIEGLITMFTFGFLRKVKPEALGLAQSV